MPTATMRSLTLWTGAMTAGTTIRLATQPLSIEQDRDRGRTVRDLTGKGKKSKGKGKKGGKKGKGQVPQR